MGIPKENNHLRSDITSTRGLLGADSQGHRGTLVCSDSRSRAAAITLGMPEGPQSSIRICRVTSRASGEPDPERIHMCRNSGKPLPSVVGLLPVLHISKPPLWVPRSDKAGERGAYCLSDASSSLNTTSLNPQANLRNTMRAAAESFGHSHG